MNGSVRNQAKCNTATLLRTNLPLLIFRVRRSLRRGFSRLLVLLPSGSAGPTPRHHNGRNGCRSSNPILRRDLQRRTF